MHSGECVQLSGTRQVCGHGKHQLQTCHHSSHIKHTQTERAASDCNLPEWLKTAGSTWNGSLQYCQRWGKVWWGFFFFLVRVGVFFSPRIQTAARQTSAWWCRHRLPARPPSRSRRTGRSGCSACFLWFARLWEERWSSARETLPEGKQYIATFLVKHVSTELKQFTWFTC